MTSTLIIGYGNPGRQDDGLGPTLIQMLEADKTPGHVTLSENYQLTVEDAMDVARVDQVIFADASLQGDEAYEFYQIFANQDSGLGSHSLEPEALLQLCATLYHQQPKAYMLAIRGYQFDAFQEALSPKALCNLRAAKRFLSEWLVRHA